MALLKKQKQDVGKGKVDWGTAMTGIGFGFACMFMGGLVFWASASSGASGPSGNALKLSQRIVAVLPNSLKQKLAFLVAVVMFIGGIFLFVMGCYSLVKDIASKK